MAKAKKELKVVKVEDVRGALFWDTFQSWRDKLEPGHDKFRLFGGHKNGTTPPGVTNFDQPFFYDDQSFLIQKVGIQILASSPEIEMAVRTGAVAELSIRDRRYLELPASIAWVPAGPLSEEEEEPRGLISLEEKDLLIKHHENFQVLLTFTPELGNITRDIATRTGPSGGWFSIAWLMFGAHTRASF